MAIAIALRPAMAMATPHRHLSLFAILNTGEYISVLTVENLSSWSDATIREQHRKLSKVSSFMWSIEN